MSDATPRVAIMPWGDRIEDFLDPLGLELADMATSLSEGWLFGYVKAFRAVGIEAHIVVVSDAIDSPTSMIHADTGAPMHALPSPRAHRLLRAHVGDDQGRPWIGSPRFRTLTAMQKYAATPIRGLRSLLRVHGIDALVVQEYEYQRFDQAALRLRSLPRGVHATYQGANDHYSRLEHRIRSRALARATSLITPARSEVARMRESYGDMPVLHVVPNPIDTELWAPADRDVARASLAIDPDEALFVCHGRIDIERKGLDILLDAWRTHCEQRTGATRLVLIGSGQDDETFRSMVANVASVDWLDGYELSRPFLRNWLAASDAYVSASRLEGMPLAPLEAMACGRAVLVSDAPGLADIAMRSSAPDGFAVTHAVGDVAELASHFTAAAADRVGLHRRGDTARREAVSTYGLDAVGGQLAELVLGTR